MQPSCRKELLLQVEVQEIFGSCPYFSIPRKLTPLVMPAKLRLSHDWCWLNVCHNVYLFGCVHREGEEVVKEVEPLASAQDYIEIIKQLKTAQQQVQEEIRLEEEKHQERKRQFEEETKRLRDGMRRISHSTTPSALRTAVENELPPEIINQTPALSAFLTQEQPEPEQAADTDFDNIDWGGSLRIRKVPDMDKEDEPAFKKPLIVEL
eukprot:m.135549 g.135549  ORF g.135549 m.135549 type:complete len:208 (-) comp15849_c2_seq3:106-729(-)